MSLSGMLHQVVYVPPRARRPAPPRQALFTFRAELGRTFQLQFLPRKCVITDQAGTIVFVWGSPYAGQHLDGLSFFQTADVVWIGHPELRLRILARYGDRDWRGRVPTRRLLGDASAILKEQGRWPAWAKL